MRVRLALVVFFAVLAAGAWFVLDDRAAKVERALSEHRQPPAPGTGPELAIGAPRSQQPAPRHAESSAASPATAGSPAWRLEGRVIGHGAIGVAGARVHAVLRRGETEALLPQAATDRDGGFAIDLAPVRALGRFALTGVLLRVVASADGHAPVESHDHVVWPTDPEADFTTQRVLELPPGDILRGRVLRADGSPMGGAMVACCDGRQMRQDTRSGPDGGFVLARPRDAASRWFVLGYSPVAGVGRVDVPTPGQERTLPDLVLEAAHGVEGRVVSADGAPLGGIVIMATTLAAVDPCWPGSWITGRARSRADGSFRVHLASEGPCQVRAEEMDSEEGVTCRTGDRDVRLVIRLHRIRVRVVDGEGRALPGVGLSAYGWEPENAGQLDELLARRITPDEAGAFADRAFGGGVPGIDGSHDFFSAPGSAWVFIATAPGSAPAEASVRVPAEGNETEALLQLRPAPLGGSLRVRVEDPDGEPVRASVAVTTALGSDLVEGPVPGVGVLGPCPPGPVHLAAQPLPAGEGSVWAPPFDFWLLAVEGRAEVRAEAIADVTLRCALGGRVRVTLRPPSADAARGASYAVRAVAAGGRRGQMLMGEASSPRTGFSSQWVAGPATRVPTLLAPGDYRLEVFASGAGSYEPAGAALVTVRAREVTDVTVDLVAR